MAKGIEYWKTGQNYYQNEYVATPEEVFIVMMNHTASTVSADLAAGKLKSVADHKRLYYLDTNGTLTPNRSNLYRIDTYFNSVTITLDSLRAYDGLEIIFKKVGGVYPFEINCAGGGMIDNNASYVMTGAWETLHLVYDEDVVIWWIV